MTQNTFKRYIKMKARNIINDHTDCITRVVVSCGSTDPLEQKKADFAAAKTQLKELQKQISTWKKKLEQKIQNSETQVRSTFTGYAVVAERTSFDHRIEAKG